MDSRKRNVAIAGAATVLLSMGIVAVNASAEDNSSSSGTGAVSTTDPTGTLGAVTASTTSLVLTVTPQGGAAKSVTLTCPAGGTHPDAKDACTALDAAGGDPSKITPTQGQMCPNIIRPVTAAAAGTYQGKPLSWTQHFNNSCELERATHPLFSF